jgi:hypothetical protein
VLLLGGGLMPTNFLSSSICGVLAVCVSVVGIVINHKVKKKLQEHEEEFEVLEKRLNRLIRR